MRRATLLLAASTGRFHVVAVLLRSRSSAIGWMQELAVVVVPFIAAGACGVAASRTRDRERVSWAAFAGGAAAWGIAALVSTIAAHGPSARTFSYTDIGYLALLPAWLTALIAIPAAPRRGFQLASASIDAVSILVVAVTSVVAWVVDPALSSRVAGGGAHLFVAYPIGDVVLISAFVFLAARSTFGIDSAQAYIGAGLTALAAADSGFAVQQLHASHRAASAVEVAWLGTFAALAIASTRGFRRPEQLESPTRPQVVAIAAALTTAGLLMAGLVDRRRPVLLVGALISAILVVVRRFSLLFENARLLHDVREHAEVAERSSRERERFIAEAAHQLITPITSARLNIDEVALIPRDDAAFGEYIRNVQTSIERLQGLAERLLTMGSFDVPRPKAPVEVSGVVRDALARLDGRARLARVELEIQRLPEEAYFAASPGAVEEALVSILDNAVKYSPTYGKVIIAASELRDRVVITVEDEGPGIEESKLEDVFDPFYRLGSSTVGYGLGLAIARRICDNHDATISLSRRPGGGTLGAIVWPAAEPSASAGA